jgi:hypothetical protein
MTAVISMNVSVNLEAGFVKIFRWLLTRYSKIVYKKSPSHVYKSIMWTNCILFYKKSKRVVFQYITPCSLAQFNVLEKYCLHFSASSETLMAIYQTTRFHTTKTAVSSCILSELHFSFIWTVACTTFQDRELSDVNIVPTFEFTTASAMVDSRLVG